MNAHELAEKYKLPVRKLLRMEKDGFLNTVPTDPRPARMRVYLSSGRPLSVEQLIELKRDEKLLAKIGRKYVDRAEAQLEALGDIEQDAIPADVAANWVYGAGIGDPSVIHHVAEWLKATIPVEGCGYHYVAVRMMWNVPGPRWGHTYSFLARAIINLRAMPTLDGWSSKEGRELTRFHRPENLASLDL